MEILKLQQMLEDNQEDIDTEKRKLQRLKNKLEKATDENEKQMLENKIIECKRDILEYKKDDYRYKDKIKKIELQEMKAELDSQLESGMISQAEYDSKSSKLKKYIQIQELYTDVKIAECNEKSQRILSEKNGLSDELENSLINDYKTKKEERRDKAKKFSQEKKVLEIKKLRDKRDTGEISVEEYRNRARAIRSELNVNRELDEFEDMYEEMQTDVYEPKIEKEQAIQTYSEMMGYKGKIVEYQGKQQSFDEIFINHMAERLAKNYKNLDNLRKNIQGSELTDYGIDQISDLQAYFKEQIGSNMPENLEEILKSNNRSEIVFSIPTVDGKSIPVELGAMAKLIGEMQTIIDEQENSISNEEKSISKEQENEKIKFSEPKESIKQQNEEKTMSLEEYMEMNYAAFNARESGNMTEYERITEKLKTEKPKYKVEDLQTRVQDVSIEEKRHVENGINRAKNRELEQTQTLNESGRGMRF